MKEYIVVAKDESVIDRLHTELTKTTVPGPMVDAAVPNRAVEVANPRLANPRITHYFLTDAEAEILKGASGVVAVHTPPGAGTKIPFVLPQTTATTQLLTAFNNTKGNFNRNSAADQYNVNWGLRRTSVKAAEFKIGTTYSYDVDGAGVDIVIMDDGIQGDHPEFLDVTGATRVQQLDWYAATGVPGVMPRRHYDVSGVAEGEHGTHVAAIAAGKTFGYAKNARIYSIRIFGAADQTIPDADQFDLIRIWHSKKPIDGKTGARRPTIVNMSWGYAWYYDNQAGRPIINAISYRKVLHSYTTPVNPQIQYGQISSTANPYGGLHGFRVPSVDAEAQDCESAGVVMVHSAGNSGHKIDTNAGVDFNNYYTTTQNWAGMIPIGQPIYYQQGSSPRTINNITVSSGDDITVLVSNQLKDRLAVYSERGPFCDVVAPGSNITSATSKKSSFNPMQYVWKSASSADTSNKVCKISGTSMAAPQVTGTLALYLSRNPTAKPSAAKAWIANIGIKNQVLTSIATDDFANTRALLGGSNNYLYNPYHSGFKD